MADDFIAEAKVKKIQTLKDLNHYWEIFLEEYYHNRAHEGIREYYESIGTTVPKEGISPLQEFNRDTRPLTFLDTTVVGKPSVIMRSVKLIKVAVSASRDVNMKQNPADWKKC